ncbi:MAG TPA: hypothetical protein VJG83_05120 [archaeon]|nr:hypothetical protein [archaeon]
MIKGKYEIIFMRHAILRAIERNITPDVVENAVMTGSFHRFGKNRMKIIKKLRKMQIVCIDEIIGNTIKIVSIARRARR